MFNEVSGALYRIGHSMVSAHIMRIKDSGEVATGGSFPFRDAFFRPDLVNDPETVAEVLKGVASKPMQEIDCFVVDDLRNFLFASPGHGGMDLISINLQRGRDHGLPSYTKTRAALGLSELESFAELTTTKRVAETLETAYGELGSVDLWIGAVSEDHLPGASVGATMATALAMQFEHLRDGDRFFFLWDEGLSDDEKNRILSTTLAEVIRRHTGTENLQEAVFFSPPVDEWMDGDTDGVPDIHEVLAGTDPRDASSQFRLTTMRQGGAFIELSWDSVPGRRYILQYSSDLNGDWQMVADTPIEANAGQLSQRVLVTPRDGDRAGFYRVVLSP